MAGNSTALSVRGGSSPTKGQIMPRNVLKWLRRLLRRDPRRLACCGIVSLVLLVGCAHERVVVRSSCPEPNPAEARDLSDWLLEKPERPAQVWAARVVGRMYSDDLEALRGAEDGDTAWGWMMPPWWGDDE